MRLLKALDRNRRVTAVPFQKRGTPGSVGLTLEQFSKRMVPLVETRRVLSLLYSLNAEGSFLGKVHPFRERL